MIDSYGQYYFDIPVTYFSAEVYSKGCTTSVFSVHKKDGTKQFILPSNNIDNWKMETFVTTADNPFIYVSMYTYKTTEDELTYIDINGFYASLATVAEEKVPYIPPQTATANADGTVEGIMSVSPTSILTADNSVTITAEYWLDAGRKINDMEQTIMTAGGDL